MPQDLVLSRTGNTHARTALRLRLPTFCLATGCARQCRFWSGPEARKSGT
jgi:hypothetical protein